MGHKVDISEVIDFSDEFKLTSEEIKDSLLKVELCIEEFCNMSSFSGETADQAKLYFIDFHLTVLTTFKGVLTDLFNKLNNHIETFQSRVDKSSRAIVQSHYLTDVMEDVNKGNRTLQAEHKVVSNIIRSVSDISSATTPSLSDIEQAHHSVVNKVEDLLEDLVSFTRINKNGVLQVGNILKEIETTLNHVGAVNGNARFTNYKGDSTTKGLATLKDYNKTIVDIRQINSKSIQYMSIYEIERLMGATLKDMDETGRKILNYALIDLKNGKIDRKIYYSIFSTMIKSTKQLSEKELNEEVPQSVIRYLYDNKVEIGLDLAVNFIVESAKYIGQEVKVIGKGVGALATDIRTIGELFSRISNRTGNIIKIIGNATMKTSNFISKTGQFVQISGKVLGGSFIVASAAVGMYEDLYENGKSVGEAIMHNATSAGVGMAGGAIGTAIAAGFSITPVGWTIGAGLLATWGFNLAYNYNFLGVQDGLDYVGQKLDDVGNWVVDSVEGAGQAISKGIDAINPMNWAW